MTILSAKIRAGDVFQPEIQILCKIYEQESREFLRLWLMKVFFFFFSPNVHIEAVWLCGWLLTDLESCFPVVEEVAVARDTRNWTSQCTTRKSGHLCVGNLNFAWSKKWRSPISFSKISVCLVKEVTGSIFSRKTQFCWWKRPFFRNSRFCMIKEVSVTVWYSMTRMFFVVDEGKTKRLGRRSTKAHRGLLLRPFKRCPQCDKPVRQGCKYFPNGLLLCPLSPLFCTPFTLSDPFLLQVKGQCRERVPKPNTCGKGGVSCEVI